MDSSKLGCGIPPYKGLLNHIQCSSKGQHTPLKHKPLSVDSHCFANIHLKIEWAMFKKKKLVRICRHLES